MHIKTKIYHYVSLQEGDPSGRKYRKAVKTVQLWLQEVTPDQLIPAFIVGENTYYWYQEKLWWKIQFDSSEKTVEAFRKGCAKGTLEKAVSPLDTFSVMYERASALVNNRLACNGDIYVVTDEPRYCLRYNCILTQTNGKLISFVSAFDDKYRNALEFNALQEELMHKYIRIAKAIMGDNLEVVVKDRIQVLLPEAVKLPPAEDFTKSERKERIICDCYLKGVNVPSPDSNIIANREFAAVNKMYGWLYQEGILMKQAFAARDYQHVCHFGIDARDLAQYRAAMLASGIDDAALAVDILLDRDVTPCMYSGAITPGQPMATHRSTDTIVSKSWECSMMQLFSSEGANEILEISQRDCVKSAVATMFERIPWKQDCISVKDPDMQKL